MAKSLRRKLGERATGYAGLATGLQIRAIDIYVGGDF